MCIRDRFNGEHYISESGSNLTAEMYSGQEQRTVGHEFSKREKAILNLLAENLNREQISSRLTISSKAVDFHLNNMLSKYKLETTEELIGLMKENNQ